MKSSNIRKQVKFEYESRNDLLYLYDEKQKVDSSITLGDFHFEVNKYLEIVGIEVLNAPEILREYTISKEILTKIEDVELKVVRRKNSVIVSIVLHALRQEKTATIAMNSFD